MNSCMYYYYNLSQYDIHPYSLCFALKKKNNVKELTVFRQR